MERVTKRLTLKDNCLNQWPMKEASNSRDLQRVYEFRVFDGTCFAALKHSSFVVRPNQVKNQRGD